MWKLPAFTVTVSASSFLRGTFNIFMHERFKSLRILKATWALSHFKLSVFNLRNLLWDVYDSQWDYFNQTSLFDLKLKNHSDTPLGSQGPTQYIWWRQQEQIIISGVIQAQWQKDRTSFSWCSVVIEGWQQPRTQSSSGAQHRKWSRFRFSQTLIKVEKWRFI